MAARLPRLMLVTDRHETRGRDLVEVVTEAVGGGVELVQVREKDLPDDELLALVLRLKASLPPGVRLLVNGRPAVARAAEVGLHLAAAARGDGPLPALYGRAAHDEVEARRAMTESVAYLLVGPVFPTTSKPGHPGSGLGLVSRVSQLVAPTPVFAIGGMTPDTVGRTLRSGAHGVAVRSAILAAPDPLRAARGLAHAIARAAASA